MTLPPGLDRFDHLVVLMMENRSFDNLLGFAYENDHPQRFIGRGTLEYRGVAGRNDLFNLDAGNPPQKVFVGKAPGETPMQMCEPCPDPGEFYQPHVNRQVYGSDVLPGSFSQLPDPAPMSGFVQDYIRSIKEQEFWDGTEPTLNQYRAIMNCFTPDSLPVTTGLARAFAVSDEWFASVPSQTFCNRSFLHSAQSNGWVTNSDYMKWRLNDHPTIFDRLTDKLGPGRDWRIYFDRQEAFSLTWALHPTLRHAQYRDRFRHFDRFEQDCKNGDLPAYTFIEPRLVVNHNDMHPPVVPNQEVESSVLAVKLLDQFRLRCGAQWQELAAHPARHRLRRTWRHLRSLAAAARNTAGRRSGVSAAIRFSVRSLRCACARDFDITLYRARAPWSVRPVIRRSITHR